ncbi:hypothetical protein ACFE04_015199 [Oxalis oulophora]
MERSTIMKDFNGCSLAQQQKQHVQMSNSIRSGSSFSSSYARPYGHGQSINIHDSEISIFDAQKYFDESNIEPKPIRKPTVLVPPAAENKVMVNLEQISENLNIPRISSASSADGFGRNFYKAHSFHATPTVSSEASWNSQTGLLSNPPGAFAVSLRNPADNSRGGRKSKWPFGMTCPCSGKKSVQVQENLSEPKVSVVQAEEKLPEPKVLERSSTNPSPFYKPASPNDHLRRISADQNHFSSSGQRDLASGTIRPFGDVPVVAPPQPAVANFTFPILNSNQSSSPMKVVLSGLPPVISTLPEEEPARNSLEVFRPPSNENQQRSMMTRRSFTFLGSPKARLTIGNDDDVASDASSDLFEIESFSTQTTTLYRDSLDDASSFNAMINGGYNIPKSLDDATIIRSSNVTLPRECCYEPSEASIDWSVTTADIDDVSSHFAAHVSNGKKKGGGSGSGGGGGLLSCRSEKAVSVGPQPVKYNVGGERQKDEGPYNNTMRHVRSRPQGVNVVGKPPIGKSPSDSLNIPFTK